jgi:hypothetical protein
VPEIDSVPELPAESEADMRLAVVNVPVKASVPAVDWRAPRMALPEPESVSVPVPLLRSPAVLVESSDANDTVSPLVSMRTMFPVLFLILDERSVVTPVANCNTPVFDHRISPAGKYSSLNFVADPKIIVFPEYVFCADKNVIPFPPTNKEKAFPESLITPEKFTNEDDTVAPIEFEIVRFAVSNIDPENDNFFSFARPLNVVLAFIVTELENKHSFVAEVVNAPPLKTIMPVPRESLDNTVIFPALIVKPPENEFVPFKIGVIVPTPKVREP